MGEGQDLKWDIQDELRKVPMKTPAKALMWDLLSRARAKDAVIPEDHTPSLTELEGSTNLGRSTVTTYLRALVATGWVVRNSPSTAESLGHGQRTLYRLAVGSFDLPPVLKHEKHKRKPRKDSASGSSGADLGQEMNQDGPGDDLAKPVETGLDSSGDDLVGNAARSGDDLVVGQEMNQPRSGDDLNKEPLTEVLSSSVHQGSSSAPDPAPKPKKRAKKPELQRDDVDELCSLLTKWVAENGFDIPADDTEWRREARLMLDKDGREFAKALALIDWCQQDMFWRKNIQSMGKFREQYNRLRLDALDAWEKTRGTRGITDSRSVSNDDERTDWIKEGRQ